MEGKVKITVALLNRKRLLQWARASSTSGTYNTLKWEVHRKSESTGAMECAYLISITSPKNSMRFTTTLYGHSYETPKEIVEDYIDNDTHSVVVGLTKY